MNRWAIVGRPAGTFLADILRKLREGDGLLGDIFAQSVPRFNNPVNLKRLRHDSVRACILGAHLLRCSGR